LSIRPLIAIFGLAALAMVVPMPHAAAQTRPPRYVRQRIEIYPRPLLYRHCVDWYELQRRPSGTVLYPQMRCWWARG